MKWITLEKELHEADEIDNKSDEEGYRHKYLGR